MVRCWLLICLCAFACAPPKRECNHLPQAPHSVAVLGDSRIFDHGLKNWNGFANYLNQDPSFRYFANTSFVSEDSDPRTSTSIRGSDYYCNVGNTPEFALRTLPHVLAAPHDAMLIHLGVNGVGNPASTEAGLEQIAESGRAKGWNVWMVTVGPWRGYPTWTQDYQNGMDRINQWIRGQAARYTIIDVNPVVADPDHTQFLRAEYTWDKLHYTSIAHGAIAADFIARIKSSGCGWESP